MNEQLKNSFFRLITIISLLKIEGGFTIAQLADYLEIPIQVIRGDIDALMQIDPEKIYVMFENDAVLDAFSENKAKAQNALLKGAFDNESVCVLAQDGGEVELVLTNSQANILSSFLKSTDYVNIIKQVDSVFLTKGVNSKLKSQYVEWKVLLETRINEGKCVKITYKNRNNEIFIKDIRPVKVIQNYDTNQIYVIDSLNIIRRFDRIKKIEFSKAEIEIDPETAIDWDKVWGMEVSETPTHVKIKINDIGLLEKDVIDDIKEKIIKENDYYIYEDEILGINAFRSWINSQGDNVLVLEPQELRDRVIRSLNERLEWYEKDNC